MIERLDTWGVRQVRNFIGLDDGDGTDRCDSRLIRAVNLVEQHNLLLAQRIVSSLKMN